MESFGEFYRDFVSVMLTEDIEDIKDQLSSEGIFSYFGKQDITDRFQWYKDAGIVPTKRLSKAASSNQATRVNRGDASGDKNVMIDVDKKEEAEMLTYVFKFLDKEVRDKLENAYKDDPKKTKKFNKHYNGVTTRDVEEDASQIKGVLSNWLVLRHDKKNNVPKSIRQKINFTDLQTKVDSAYNKLTGANASEDAKTDVDGDMPEGFSFVKATGNFRLYKWHTLGDVCDMRPSVKKNWMSLVITISGEADEKWCVADSKWAIKYGQPDADGAFKYPYYLLRKKVDGNFVPYVLMHGDSLQCKNDADVPISQAMGDEIRPAIKEHLNTIIFGDEPSR